MLELRTCNKPGKFLDPVDDHVLLSSSLRVTISETGKMDSEHFYQTLILVSQVQYGQERKSIMLNR